MRAFARLLLSVAVALTSAEASAQSDTVFIYSPGEHDGLHIAVKESSGWRHLGQLCSSDYGPWGSEKRMYNPSLCRADDGSWRLVFQVNDHSPVFAAAYSPDLVTWRPQDYPRMSVGQCQDPVVRPAEDGFNIYFHSEEGIRMTHASSDFRTFTPDFPMPIYDLPLWRCDVATIGGQRMEGHQFVLSADEMGKIRNYFDRQAAEARLSAERMHDDAQTLAWLQEPVAATLTVDLAREKPISDKLIGIFFEDISYAADGGLYAELIQNRDFEYSSRDRREWSATTAWHSAGDIIIADTNPLSPQNPHHAIVSTDTLWNEGWDGIALQQGGHYDFSMFVRGKKCFRIELRASDGTTIAQATLKGKGKGWRRYEAVLTPTRADSSAQLVIIPLDKRQAAIDMVSLFPQATFKGRKNGLRKDLAETIAALHPKFVRFPGGCMSHGQGLDNIYRWHETIGPLWERKPDKNIWHYHQTRGLGFYEYFLFCEDIGAEPLPVLAAGVPCQNSAANAEGIAGQQGGIPMDEMAAYIDELCHLIEWANADPATNVWARRRAEAGHPEPFHLKYLGIGNEDIISTVFEERYEMIARALRERHPEIKLCGTVGPFHAPSADYQEGWDFIARHPDLQYMTDEHYYESTGWFLHHRDYYDKYKGVAPCKVYLGEWAASTKARRPNVETALAEALYLTDIERNGDVVEMTSYAPMLCKEGHHNWDPNMIYFTNTSVRTTPAYEVQRLFSVYSGDRYVSSELKVHGVADADLSHRVGASLVRDSKTGRRCLKLVNALPVELRVDVGGVQLPAIVECEQFNGAAIDDQQGRAEVIKTDTPTILPPYSIRVIEF